MTIFFHKLVSVLNKERKNWRENTVVLLDGAAYHTAPAILKVFQDLRIPVLFTGPHSYDAAPIELFFAAFKRENINPNRIKTGKA